jgi:hypothetical protein
VKPARIIDCEPAEYFQLPGFSSSVAKELIARSPLHARCRDDEERRPPTSAMDRGSVVHKLVLGRGADFVPVEASDWRTKAAKEARDAARKEGKIGILVDDLEDARRAADKVTLSLAAAGLVLRGRSEVAIQWDEELPTGSLLCRGMLDHLIDDGTSATIIDLKTTANAAPSAVERVAESLGYAIQAAAYTHAVERLRPELAGRVRFIFAFVEIDAPFAVNLCAPDGAFRELGATRWRRACEGWAACVATDQWPAYGQGINTLSPPPWALRAELYA